MPDTPTSQSLRLKFAAIAAVGAAIVLLPLGQVLRYQNADLQALVAERATLDPLTHALAVQRSLLGHRDVTERVLRGRLQLEAERRLRKTEVDESLWALQGTLSAGFWLKALAESDALTQDWRTLASRVALRQLQAADSQDSHQLLVEQAVQVMDLVSAATPAGSYAQLTRVASLHPLPAAQARTMEAALQARHLETSNRIAILQARQAALATALAALASFALGAALWAAWAWRQMQRAPGDATPPAGDGVRRGRGRRTRDMSDINDMSNQHDASDTRVPKTTSSQLLQRLRTDAATAAAEPLASRPPSG